jgi:DNA-binding NtrC family response regulator
MKTILELGENPLEADALRAVLVGEYRLVFCEGPALAPEILSREKPVAVLVDLSPWTDAKLELITRVATGELRPPVIAMSAVADPHSVIAAVRRGAADFITKPLRLAELRAALRRVVVPPTSEPFVGSSAAARRMAETLRSYARHDYPVLIRGESGTGKEIAAHGLHVLSARSNRSFVARNCAAFPEELVDSELFGSERGAFTGAIERPGAFELADGGTLFLDEIAEASAPIQAKLLRVLESGDLWRLGDRRERRADVRLVSATSTDLDRAIADKRFRSDLLYRIDTLILELPPLRERLEDLPDLARHFVHDAVGGKKRFSDSALDRLLACRWPGNIRQLKNVVHRAIVLSGELEEIGPDHVVI